MRCVAFTKSFSSASKMLFENVCGLRSMIGNHVLCNLPHFRVRSIWLSTGRVFRDDTAERRPLRVAQRRLTVTAVFAKVVDSADPARWRKLLEDVGASADNPAYVFVTMDNDGQVRDFLVGVDLTSALAR